MIKAIIKKAIPAPYEVAVYNDGGLIASIMCMGYDVIGGMILCYHDKYNSYVHYDEYTCETWKD